MHYLHANANLNIAEAHKGQVLKLHWHFIRVHFSHIVTALPLNSSIAKVIHGPESGYVCAGKQF